MAVRYWSCASCLASLGEKFTTCPRCKKTEILYFQSGKERNRYAALRLQEKHGLISGLIVHPVYPLHVQNPGGQRIQIAKYIADFGYRQGTGGFIVEDVKASDSKSALDPVFVLKRKHVEAQYGLVIQCYT